MTEQNPNAYSKIGPEKHDSGVLAATLIQLADYVNTLDDLPENVRSKYDQVFPIKKREEEPKSEKYIGLTLRKMLINILASFSKQETQVELFNKFSGKIIESTQTDPKGLTRKQFLQMGFSRYFAEILAQTISAEIYNVMPLIAEDGEKEDRMFVVWLNHEMNRLLSRDCKFGHLLHAF